MVRVTSCHIVRIEKIKIKYNNIIIPITQYNIIAIIRSTTMQ